MRLPFIQVAQEAWGNARMLAGLLKIDRHQAMGLLVDLYQWAVDLGPSDEPPTGVCISPVAAQLLVAAVEWRGKGDLVQALVAIGALEILEDGLRVRGVPERYGATWEKRKKDRERKAGGNASAPSGVPLEVARKSHGTPGESQGKTQTQTQTQKEEKPPPPVAEAVVLDQVPIAELPDTPAGFWEWAKRTREARGLPPENRPNGLAAWHKAARAVARIDQLCDAYRTFIRQPWSLERGQAPLSLFIADGVWPGRLPVEAAAERHL